MVFENKKSNKKMHRSIFEDLLKPSNTCKAFRFTSLKVLKTKETIVDAVTSETPIAFADKLYKSLFIKAEAISK